MDYFSPSVEEASTNNLPRFSTLIEYFLFSGFVYLQLKNNSFKKIIIYCAVVYTAFSFIYAFSQKGVVEFDSVAIGVETIFIITFCFFYLYEQMNDTSTLFIFNRFPFWIVLAIILYLSGCFFIYIFANYLTKSEMTKFWPITNMFSFLKSVLFSVAMAIDTKKHKEQFQSTFQ